MTEIASCAPRHLRAARCADRVPELFPPLRLLGSYALMKSALASYDSRHPIGQDGERLWSRPVVARAGSDDHAGEAARPAPLEAGVRVPSPGPGGECILSIHVHHRRWSARPEPIRAGV